MTPRAAPRSDANDNQGSDARAGRISDHEQAEYKQPVADGGRHHTTESPTMLRWLIALLVIANLLAFATARGLFGPAPAAGAREPSHMGRQIHPDVLRVQPMSAADAADQAVVGGPAPVAPIAASALAQ
jgi:hypothetical protein